MIVSNSRCEQLAKKTENDDEKDLEVSKTPPTPEVETENGNGNLIFHA